MYQEPAWQGLLPWPPVGHSWALLCTLHPGNFLQWAQRFAMTFSWAPFLSSYCIFKSISWYKSFFHLELPPRPSSFTLNTELYHLISPLGRLCPRRPASCHSTGPGPGPTQDAPWLCGAGGPPASVTLLSGRPISTSSSVISAPQECVHYCQVGECLCEHGTMYSFLLNHFTSLGTAHTFHLCCLFEEGSSQAQGQQSHLTFRSREACPWGRGHALPLGIHRVKYNERCSGNPGGGRICLIFLSSI